MSDDRNKMDKNQELNSNPEVVQPDVPHDGDKAVPLELSGAQRASTAAKPQDENNLRKDRSAEGLKDEDTGEGAELEKSEEKEKEMEDAKPKVKSEQKQVQQQQKQNPKAHVQGQKQQPQAEEAPASTIDLKGADLDVSFDNGKIKITVEHVGKVGYANLEVGGDALPFVNKILDKIEEIIPGDQKAMAQVLKSAVANLKF